jgi:hypothetical protein
VTFNNNPILFSDPLGLEAQDQLPVKPSFLTDANSGGGNTNHKHGKGPDGHKIQLPSSANIKYFTSNKFKIPGSNKVVNTPIGSIKSFQVRASHEYVQEHGYIDIYNNFEAYFSSETGDFIGYYDLEKNLHYTPEKIFEKQEEAFEYFWGNSIQNKTENGMYILKSGQTYSVLDYNIITKEGRSYLQYNGKWEEILAVGHTHPVYMAGTTAEGGDAGGDCGFHEDDQAAATRVSFVYHFVIGKDGTFDGTYMLDHQQEPQKFLNKGKKVTRDDLVKGKVNILKLFKRK